MISLILYLCCSLAYADGPSLFKANCAVCHGNEGKGDGPASITFNPKPRNLVSDTFKNGDKVEQIENTLRIGLGQMPSFFSLADSQRHDLALYVKSLRK